MIDHVNYGNNYVFSIPILILTDHNSVLNVEKSISSVSFSEFARMLKALPANIYLKDALGRYVFSSQTWHHLDTEGDPEYFERNPGECIHIPGEGAKPQRVAGIQYHGFERR